MPFIDVILFGGKALVFLRSSSMHYRSRGVPIREDHRDLDDETCFDAKVSKSFSFVGRK